MHSHGTKASRLSRLQKWLLALILICGAVLRFYNLAWDHGTLPHPDERSTVAFYAPSLHWPESLEQALDARRSPLNPFWDVEAGHRRSYTYGHFPLYTLALTAAAIQSLAPTARALSLPAEAVAFMETARSPVGFAIIGRFLMALADMASIYLLFLLGRRLYGVWAGLLAAAFSAFTVLQIQLAHFFAVDPISATFVFLALYASIHLAERRSVGAAFLTGLAIGLAVACKFSALPISAAPVVALMIRRPETNNDESSPAGQPKWGLLILVACVALVTFALTSPFVFLDFQNFWQSVVQEQGDMVTGVADFPFTRQYRGTLPYLYFLEQQVLWGMGPPLGVLALLGLLWAIWRALRRQAVAGEYVILAWLILYFGPTGLFLAKFMRYMAPVTPLLVLFGAGMVAHQSVQKPLNLEGETEGSSSRRFITLRSIAGGLALLGAMMWALAFVNGVYGSEHPWVTASRWVYQNIPDGACIAAEHWEEGFPQSLPEPGMNPGAHGYRQPLLPMYEEDTPDKFQIIKETLKHCDYLVLASNRLWRTIPRLPQRYPMSVRYYEALFSGELGFEPIYTWSASPRLGPLVIDDQVADESFTVYDHPRPIIFRKTRQLSDVEWEQLLGGLWQKAMPGYVGPPPALAWLRKTFQMGWVVQSPAEQSTEKRKSLLLDTPVDALPVVNDFRWNTLANSSTIVAVVCWWLAVQFLGWLAWPVARQVLGTLSDQGFLLAKSLGWLLVSYGVWILSSLRVLPNALLTIGVWVLVLMMVSTWLFWRDRQAIRDLFRRRGRFILLGEGVFALVFLYFVGLRVLNPDLWQPWNGGEKMLEIGFLNAIVKSPYMPPYDPYFAGGYINYYYYGLFLVGILVKLTGIQPTVAFNLAVPLLAGLTASNVFCLAYNLALSADARIRRETKLCVQNEGHLPGRPLLASLLAVMLVMFIGNLAGFRQLVRYLEDAGGSNFATGLPLVGEVVRKFLMTLWNTYSFFVTYANIDNFQPGGRPAQATPEDALLDRWIRSELNSLVREVTRDLDEYDPTSASRRIEDFVDDLSNWYVRRSRRRFWKSESDADKLSAYQTLYACLTTLAQLLAPFTPFISEELYQNLVRTVEAGAPESIHLTDWPAADVSAIDEELNADMRLAMRLASLGRAARSRANIKVRQPLETLMVKLRSPQEREAALRLQGLIIDELNVKRLEIVDSESDLVRYEVRPKVNLLGPKYGRRLPAIRSALAQLDPAEVARRKRADEDVTVAVDGETVALLPEEIEVNTIEREGYAVAEEAGYVVGVSRQLTPELVREGLARELVHRIQGMRKSAGFDITDTIVTYYLAPEAVSEVIRDFADYVKQETLSRELIEGQPSDGYQETQRIDGSEVKLTVVRRP